MKKVLLTLALAVGAVVFAACSPKAEQQVPADTNSAAEESMNDSAMGDESMGEMEDSEAVMVGGAPMYPDRTIVENASESEAHTTLVAAVEAAGLVETLNGEGPFTVFAPTNAAFEALPEGTVETLLQPENQEQLQAILTYHVVPGMATAADLSDGQTLTTVQGEALTVQIDGGTVMVVDANGTAATVTTADAVASNGVVHVIDSVLQPAQ